jgi:hypothetical protein
MKKTLIPIALLLMVFVLVPSRAHAQSTTPTDSLFKTIESLDSRFFDAYNHCDLATISSMVADNLEFYHDVTGQALGRQALCGWCQEQHLRQSDSRASSRNAGGLSHCQLWPGGNWCPPVSITQETKILRTSGRRSSSRCGKTQMEFGRSPVLSALITTPLQNGPINYPTQNGLRWATCAVFGAFSGRSTH